jgi:hypothetical protein
LSSWNHRLFVYYLARVLETPAPPRNDLNKTARIEQLIRTLLLSEWCSEIDDAGFVNKRQFFRADAAQVSDMALPVSWLSLAHVSRSI